MLHAVDKSARALLAAAAHGPISRSQGIERSALESALSVRPRLQGAKPTFMNAAIAADVTEHAHDDAFFGPPKVVFAMASKQRAYRALE